MPVLIGTSGWQYRHWRGRFYPDDLPGARWLAYYTERFATVEVNNTFYRLPERATFTAWADQSPGDFVVAAKMSRYLTHIKRLRDPAEPVQRFLDHALGLGAKLGPILLQLPPTLKADAGLLDEALSAFPPGRRVAVEFRHPSWDTDEVRGGLVRHNAAWCLADPPGPGVQTGVRQTADWAYVRFHAGR